MNRYMIPAFLLGLFLANLFWHGFLNHDWHKGFWVGTIVAVLAGIVSAVLFMTKVWRF
jgi:hypothetical protein